MPTNHKNCFVIMPFSKTSDNHTEEYWTKHFDSFLKPLIEENNELSAYRSEPLHGDVLRQIISALVVSPFVVADLTDANPNVYWELGVRQSFKHCTITIAEEGTKIPFDVSVKGILFYYPKNHIKNAQFTKKFRKAIKDCLSNPDSPDSHVLETISGRGSLYEIIRKDEATRRVNALISECKSNFQILDDIYHIIKENREKPEGKRSFVTKRLRSCAIELVITTRYLDEEASFYDLAENCFISIHARNDQLSLWEGQQLTTENWFLKASTKHFRQSLQNFEKKLIRIRKKLSITS